MFLSLKNICGRSGNQIDSWLTIDLTDNKVEDIWNCRNWSHFPGCPKPPLVVASQNVGCCVKPPLVASKNAIKYVKVEKTMTNWRKWFCCFD